MDCIFCKVIKGELPSHTVYEDDRVVAFLDIAPINKGHTLIVPKKHYENTLETPDELLQHIVLVTKKLSQAILAATGANACNIGINNGRESGQVVFHTHWHIMPRFTDDGYELWKGKDMTYVAGEEAAAVAQKITNLL